MKKFLAACLVPACISAVAVPASLFVNQTVVQAAPAGSWQTVKGNGFSIQMPGKPKVEAKTEKMGQDQVQLAEYKLELSTNAGYGLMVMEMPISFTPKSRMAQEMLDTMTQPSKQSKQKVVARQSLTLGGNPGREVTLSDGKESGKIRVFLVQNRMYMMAAGGNSGKLSPQNIDRFLQSFKLTK
jgi:hypothetical protein